MTQQYPTSLGTSDADTITLLGQNLADDLMGKVGFGELTLWMVTQRRPTQSEVRVFESVLVALQNVGASEAGFNARAAQRTLAVRIIFHGRGLEHLHEGDAHALGNGCNVLQNRHMLFSIPKPTRTRP